MLVFKDKVMEGMSPVLVFRSKVMEQIYLALVHFVCFTVFLLFSRVHATLHPALSVGQSVGRLVGRSCISQT